MKIFLAMLFGNGFRQPFSQMDERFNLYPFRLIFKLLRDSRLKGRLYNDEAFYLIMFLKTIERDSYEELVKDILNLRARDSYDKYIEFKEYERVLGLASHEWRYFTGMLESAGIVKINNENNNRIVGQFTYGSISKKTGRPNAVRKYTEDFITLSPELFNLVDNLLASYSVYDKPFSEEELSTKFNSSIVVDMYSFYPPELLDELGMNTKEDKAIASMLNIANGINYYSREETQGGNKFENILADAFNMFIDVEAERVGGSGRVDIECLYYISENNCTKFDIEAKARNKKLVSINSRRLKTHRIGIGSKYTIVVTPSYSIGVLRDIIDAENTVVIKSSTLANYFYQYIVKFGRELSYSTLDGIIVNNFGIDISDKVNSYVYDNFGYDANDLKLTSANVK